jgi:hypothetical protein
MRVNVFCSLFVRLCVTGVIGSWKRVQSQLVVKVGPFCRKGLSPQGEPWLHQGEDCWLQSSIACTEVAASREVQPCMQDLPKSATAAIESWKQ